MIDAGGHVTAYTGEECIPGAGHLIGTNFSVQANLMLNKKVFRGDPYWVELTPRLLKVDLLKVDDNGLKKILSEAQSK